MPFFPWQRQHRCRCFQIPGVVGKSTVSALLARSFASNLDDDIGLLDIDITGPSQTLFMGVKSEEVHKSASGWTPGSTL